MRSTKLYSLVFLTSLLGLNVSANYDEVPLSILDSGSQQKIEDINICLKLYKDRWKDPKGLCAYLVMEKDISFNNDKSFNACFMALRSVYNYNKGATTDLCIGKNLNFPYGKAFITESYKNCIQFEFVSSRDADSDNYYRSYRKCSTRVLKDMNMHFKKNKELKETLFDSRSKL